MKRICLLLVFLLTVAGQGESLFDGALTMNIPAGLTLLTPEVLQTKFPGPNAPKMAYGNDDATVTVALNMRDLDVPEAELPEFKDFMKTSLVKARPGLQFEKEEIITIGGRKWVHFIFTSTAPDATIRNEMLMGSKDGKLFMINLNATTEQYSNFAKGFTALKNSLKLN